MLFSHEWRSARFGVWPLLLFAYVNDVPSLLEFGCLICGCEVKLWWTIWPPFHVEILLDELRELERWAERWRMAIDLSNWKHAVWAGEQWRFTCLMRMIFCRCLLKNYWGYNLFLNENIDPDCESLCVCQKYAGSYPPFSSSVLPFHRSISCLLCMFLRGWRTMDLQFFRTPRVDWWNWKMRSRMPHCPLPDFLGSAMKAGYDWWNCTTLAIGDPLKI